MGVVFAKTPKGHDEITSKSGRLTPRIRRVLIFVDGKRPLEELRDMLQSDDLQHTLGMLEEEGYIEVRGISSPSGVPLPPQTPMPPITAFTDLPADLDPLRLQQARNFMANTLNTFVGSLGASSLLDRIDNADGHGELRELFDEWYHAMVMTRDGRRQAENLREKLLKVI